MKKILLIFTVFVSFNLAAQEQVKPDSSMYRTVKDTSYVEDQRLSYMVNSVLPSIAEYMQNYIRQAKVDGRNIKYAAETKTMLNKIEKAVADYSLYFRQIKDVKINKDAIVKEYNDLNAKIQTITADPDAKYLQVMQEFQRIQKRQQKLSSYYNQVK